MKKLDLLTCAGAGKLLDLTPAAVRATEGRGEIKALRTDSGLRLFKRSDIEALARERARRRQSQREVTQF